MKERKKWEVGGRKGREWKGREGRRAYSQVAP